MRGIRAVVVTATCVPAGMLALSGSTLADPGPAPPALIQPAWVPGGPVRDGSTRAEPAPAAASDPGLVRAADLVPGPRSATDPVTDPGVSLDHGLGPDPGTGPDPGSGTRAIAASGGPTVAGGTGRGPLGRDVERDVRSARGWDGTTRDAGGGHRAETGLDGQVSSEIGYGAPVVPRTSYATRHVPTAEEAALTGAMHPATDRVMTYLIAWVMVTLVGGGMLARREPRRRMEQRFEPYG